MASARAKSAPARRKKDPFDTVDTTFGNSPLDRNLSTGDGAFSINASVMIGAKEGRKRAENDLQLVANRIALLRYEEQRALEKVTETKARAQEILEIKKRNEDSLQAKVAKHVSKEMAIKEAQQRSLREREERREKIHHSRKLIEDGKRAAAVATKQTAQQIEQLKLMGKAKEEYDKRNKAEEERKRREALRLQRERERMEKEQVAQMEYARRIAEENKRKEEAEQLIDLLEREERELIERLKKTQKLQLHAFGVLQSSLEC